MIAATTSSSPPDWLLALFPVFFVCLWCFVCWVLSHVGGWHRLAQEFRASRPAVGKRHRMQSCGLGMVNYNACLTIHTSDEGMHIAVWLLFRLAHPPLLIPWSEFHQAVARRFLWWEWINVEISQPPLAKLRLSRKLVAGYEARIGLPG